MYVLPQFYYVMHLNVYRKFIHGQTDENMYLINIIQMCALFE